MVAPAMNQGMWKDPATMANIALLQQRGVKLAEPAHGTWGSQETDPNAPGTDGGAGGSLFLVCSTLAGSGRSVGLPWSAAATWV